MGLIGCPETSVRNYLYLLHNKPEKGSFLPKRLNSPGIDHIPAVLIKQEVGHFVMRPIHLLILFVLIKNCLSNGRIQSLYLFMRWGIKQTVAII